MDINNITIALRPRSNWEAFDLGFIMTRRWWSKLLLAWMLTALPVFLACAVFLHDEPMWALLVFWWFKPAYEQLPLFFISRAVFNYTPSRREILRALPSWVLMKFLPAVTWRRFSPNRAFTAPVTQLEGLRGRARRNRIRVLSGARNTGIWLTITCMHLEAVIYFSLFALVLMFVPWEYIEPFFEWFWEHPEQGDIVGNIFYFCGIAVIAPFYVVSGFSLYLNRRTRLEGWDLELAFEKLATRLKNRGTGRTAAALLLSTFLCGLFGMTAEPVLAEDNKRMIPLAEASTLIKEIMASEEFNQEETISYWRLKQDDEEEIKEKKDPGWLSRLLADLADLGYYSFWLLAAVLIILIAYLLPKLRPFLHGVSAGPGRISRSIPDTVFGLAMTPESLPDDIPGEALRLFQGGEPRQALSLLYRGSLFILISEHGLELRDSDTEGQCARRVESGGIPVAAYFHQLTCTWIRMAYAHQLPEGPLMQQLCDQWQQNFRREAS